MNSVTKYLSDRARSSAKTRAEIERYASSYADTLKSCLLQPNIQNEVFMNGHSSFSIDMAPIIGASGMPDLMEVSVTASVGEWSVDVENSEALGSNIVLGLNVPPMYETVDDSFVDMLHTRLSIELERIAFYHLIDKDSIPSDLVGTDEVWSDIETAESYFLHENYIVAILLDCYKHYGSRPIDMINVLALDVYASGLCRGHSSRELDKLVMRLRYNWINMLNSLAIDNNGDCNG